MIDWPFTAQIALDLGLAARVTVLATILGALLASGIGLLWAIARRTPVPALRMLAEAAVSFLRNTPLLVQLYFLYYVLPQWGLRLSPLATGIVGLGLHYSAYTAEIYRAGLEAVPSGQWESAAALGLGPWDTLRRVILPQAIAPIVPALGNRTIAMFKETPLLSTISVIEMLGTARITGSETFRYLEPLTLVGIYFLVMSLAAARATSWVERRLALPGARA